MFVKGSYTVEAALLMAVLLPVLMGILYLGFYLHDCAAVKGAACELSAYAGLQKDSSDGEQRVEEKKEELKNRYFPGMRDRQISMRKGDDYVDVTIQGSFSVPGWYVPFFGRQSLEVSAHSRLERKDAVKTISRLHLLKKLRGN